MTSSSIFSRVAAAVLTIALVALATHAFVTHEITLWTAGSLGVFLGILAISIGLLIRQRGEFFSAVSALFCTLVVGRLFSTMHFGAPDVRQLQLDPLMVAETGPGIDSIMWTSVALAVVLALMLFDYARRQSRGLTDVDFIGRPQASDWGLTWLRMYVGLMFIAHFSGHLFAGPGPFQVFTDYFGSIGLPFPQAFVILAGLIELAVAIGLAFGFMTRIAALGAAVYLVVSVGLGGHFSAGYVWVLPNDGWEFPALWIFAVSLFTYTGAGPVSVDRWLVARNRCRPEAYA